MSHVYGSLTHFFLFLFCLPNHLNLKKSQNGTGFYPKSREVALWVMHSSLSHAREDSIWGLGQVAMSLSDPDQQVILQ